MSLRDIRKSIVGCWQDVVSPVAESVGMQKHLKDLLLVVGGCALVAGAVWGYRYYVAHQEGKTQVALAQAIQAYHEASQGGAIGWAQVDQLLQHGYDIKPHGKLAPYFLAYRADVQIKLGKLPEAIAILALALQQMPKDSPFAHLYELKLALMRMDMLDETSQKMGLESLQSLADNKENSNRDAALYHLGLYYWDKDNRSEAAKYWQELVAVSSSKERLGMSPWAQLAQEKLAALGVQASA